MNESYINLHPNVVPNVVPKKNKALKINALLVCIEVPSELRKLIFTEEMLNEGISCKKSNRECSMR